MEIRKIDSAGVDLVAGLFDQYRIFYGQPSDPGVAREYIQARLDNRESVIFAALFEEDEKRVPVGFTQLYPCYSSVHAVKNWTLNDLYVAPAYRSRNVGTALIRTAMGFAGSQGAKFVELMTAKDNFIAQGLYERMGFVKQSYDIDFFSYRLLLNIQNQKP